MLVGPHERESKGVAAAAAAADEEWIDAGDNDSGRERSGRSAALAAAASRAAAVGDEDALLLAWWAAEDAADRADLPRPRIGERPIRKASLPLEGGVVSFGARRCIFGSGKNLLGLIGCDCVRLWGSDEKFVGNKHLFVKSLSSGKRELREWCKVHEATHCSQMQPLNARSQLEIRCHHRSQFALNPTQRADGGAPPIARNSERTFGFGCASTSLPSPTSSSLSDSPVGSSASRRAACRTASAVRSARCVSS